MVLRMQHELRRLVRLREVQIQLSYGIGKGSNVFHLDYISCVLTIVSTILVGKKCWQGWVVAGVNSVLICIIALRTSQLGLIPANLFCIGLYAFNMRQWSRATQIGTQTTEL